MRPQEISLDDLLLDPNNYRLQDLDNFFQASEERFAEEQIQSRTFAKLQNQALRSLVNSIRANGFLEIERIVVTPYHHVAGKFLVIEGNRRVAALLSLREEYRAGVNVPPRVVGIFDAVPCIVAEDEGEPFFKQALMGIRHVGGISEWGGFQRAKLIADLKDTHNLEPGDIADRLGMSVQEVNRRYRAYKALEQMQGTEEFGEFATPSMYPIFHEAVSLPAIRDWLGWSAETNLFSNDDNAELFYKLITPTESEASNEETPPKLKSYSDVRDIKNIVTNEEALATLLDDEKSLMDAKTVANRDELSRKWKSEVGEAITALKKVSALEVEGFERNDLDVLENLINTTNRILEIYRRLNQGL